MLAPLNFDRSFMSLNGILLGFFGCAPTITIFCLLKRRRAMGLDVKSGKMLEPVMQEMKQTAGYLPSDGDARVLPAVASR